MRLRDSLVSTLTFSRGKEAEVAWLDGGLTMHREENQDLEPTNTPDHGTTSIATWS